MAAGWPIQARFWLEWGSAIAGSFLTVRQGAPHNAVFVVWELSFLLTLAIKKLYP